MKPSQIQNWIDAYRQGNTDALGQLEAFCRRPLYGYIFKVTNGNADMQECYQEVWLRAIRSMDSYVAGSFISWLFRIAHNYLIDQNRKYSRKIDPHGVNENLQETSSWTARVPSHQLGPGEEAADHELGFRIETAVTQLPKEQQEVFLMRMEGDLSFKEIARIQRTSVNTALSRMQYALAKLRLVLKDDFDSLIRGSVE
jgi:RNA polymerase sigma-70 factor (ECF subfamily)